MKKNELKILMYIVTIISIVFCVIIYKENKPINISTEAWIGYDDSIENIKKNMDEITKNSENWIWWELKATNIEDENLKGAFNLLISDIRMCYLYSFKDERQKEYYIKMNPLIEYRQAKSITKDQLNKLRDDTKEGYCIETFEKYNLLLISNNIELAKDFKENVNKVYKLKDSEAYRNSETYNEIVEKEVLLIKEISNLTNWLKEEYYKYK